MDDVMLAIGSRRKILNYIQEVITHRCHHENVNYLMVVKDLMFSTNKFRMLFSNSNYIILFPNKANSRNIKHVMRSRGFNSKDVEQLMQLAFDDENNLYPYLMLDNTHNVRIRQRIFPDCNMYVYNKI